MKQEKIEYSIVPSVIFLIACLYLNFSSWTIEQGINLENEIMITFFNTLKSGDFLSALIPSISLLFFNGVLPLLPFFFLLAGGFLAIYFSLNKIDFGFFVLFQILISFITLVISNLSVFIFFVLSGILTTSVIFIKNFEEEESLFKSMRSVVSKNTFLVVLFMAAGLSI